MSSKLHQVQLPYETKIGIWVIPPTYHAYFKEFGQILVQNLWSKILKDQLCMLQFATHLVVFLSLSKVSNSRNQY